MAKASTRSRRTQDSNPSEAVNEAPIEDNSNKDKSRRTSRSAAIPTSPATINTPSAATTDSSAMEVDSSTAPSSTTEEISSNTSESGSAGTSEKSSTDASVTSDETLNKTKEELIRTAHDLDAQLQELVKIFKDEKKIFIDKSIHLLENESHPDWLDRIKELRKKRSDAIKIANERHRLKVESIMAEYDFALKNVSDEFQAAENEIIDEFTTKRKRRTLKEHKEFPGLEKIEMALNSASETHHSSATTTTFTLDERQVQNDLSAINRIIEHSAGKPLANNSHPQIKQEI